MKPGEGGYGNPLDRDIGAVLDDVLDGLVSIKSAKKDYGVVIDPEPMTVDQEATQALRKTAL